MLAPSYTDLFVSIATLNSSSRTRFVSDRASQFLCLTLTAAFPVLCSCGVHNEWLWKHSWVLSSFQLNSKPQLPDIFQNFSCANCTHQFNDAVLYVMWSIWSISRHCSQACASSGFVSMCNKIKSEKVHCLLLRYKLYLWHPSVVVILTCTGGFEKAGLN